MHGHHAQSGHERRLRRVGRRQHQTDVPAPARALGDREHACDRAHAGIQAQFADGGHGRAAARQLAGGLQDRQCHRQVVDGTDLAQAGRSEVDRDAPRRELEAGVDDGRPHTLPALLHGRIRQADDRERRRAGHDVGLDDDPVPIQPDEREAVDTAEHYESAAKASGRWRMRAGTLVRSTATRS